MKHDFLRICCLLLALLLAAACAVSCGGDGDKPPVGGEESKDSGESVTVGGDDDGGTVNWRDRLPVAKYEDVDVNMICYVAREEQFHTLEGADTTGDLYASAIFSRNSFIEDRYGVVINVDTAKSGNPQQEFVSICQSAQMSECEYDIILSERFFGLEKGDYLCNLQTFDVLNLQNPYWVSGWNDKSTINGYTFSAVGYMNRDVISNAELIFSNTYMERDLGIYGEVSQAVEDGSWTVEKMMTYAAQATSDVNGEGKPTYGLTYALWSGRALLWSAGLSLASKTDDAKVSFTLTSEKNYNIFQSLYTALRGENAYYGGRSGSYDSKETGDRFVWLDGRSLFQAEAFTFATMAKDQYADFAMYPMPKYDSDPNVSYVTSIKECNTSAIHKNAKDPVMSATILEAMNILSYLDTTPVYYDKMLKGRYSTNPETAKMVDLITDSISVDFAFVHTAFFASIADVPFDLIDPKGETENAGKGWYSAMGAYENSLNAYLEKMLPIFGVKTDTEK